MLADNGGNLQLMWVLGPYLQGRGSMLEQVAQTENKRWGKVKAGHFLFQVGKADGTEL